MRLPTFRVRTLMLAVAVVALLIWGAMIGTRWFVYYSLATRYGTYERQWREMAARDRGNPSLARTVTVVYGPQFADFYGTMARKYRRAMWRPWIPVAPDPPTYEVGK